MSSNESAAIDVLRFFSVLCIVPLHCRMSHHVQIPPCRLVGNVESWFCAFKGLPVLLFLSGWLFFRGVPPDSGFRAFWLAKLRRRIRSLGLPFLIWCVAAFVYRKALGKLPSELNVANPFHILRYLIGWDGICSHPGGFGLWYLKTLMIAAVLAPLYWLTYRVLGRIAVIAGIFCVLRPPVPIDFPFFNAWFFLGGSLAYQKVELSKLSCGFERLFPVSILLFVMYQLLQASRCHFASCLDFMPYAIALSIHGFVRKMDRLPEWLLTLSKSSTFVFFVHFFVAGGIGTALRMLIRPDTGWEASVAYILCIVGVTSVSLLGYYSLSRIAPRFLAAATGGRS